MVKFGYKHRTGIFGDDAEAYVSRLFVMMRNPNGSRRPDLISIPGSYSPRLSLEVKSGRGAKGVMVDYQLHYAITSEQDYRELFGFSSYSGAGVLEGIDIANSLPKKDIAYYYDVIDRPDEISSDEVRSEFASIKLKKGDQYIVPHQFGFYNFAVAKHLRSGEPLEGVISSLLDTIKSDLLFCGLQYKERKQDRNSWQDIHGRDIKSIFLKDEKIATEKGKRRIELLYHCYPGLGKLKPILINGPNNTCIYILAEPEHQDLFDSQLRSVVAQRRPLIEEITIQREKAIPLLDRVGVSKHDQLLLDSRFNGHALPGFSEKPLTLREIKRLELLARWENGSKQDRETDTSGIPF